MKKLFKYSSMIIFGLLLCNVEVFSQEGVHEHDGFFLRFQMGASSANMTFSMEGVDDEMSFSGLAGDGVIQIGGVVGNNLILFGELSGVTITDPTFKFNDEEVEIDDLQVTASGFGAGLTYYFMPDNIYLSGSLLAVQATAEYGSEKGESDMGFGFRASVGKEWWIGNDWGMGVALFGSYSSVPDKDNDDITITTTSFGVAFSVTYN
jgi:hypothetical protein